MTLKSDATWSKQHINALCLAGHQTIHQLVSGTELQPVAGQPIPHPKAVAAILRLLEISRCPGAFQEHHMPRSMQGETKPTCAIGRQQQITVLLLKAIHSSLTLLGTLTPGEQLSADSLMKQNEGINKTTENHHGLPV